MMCNLRLQSPLSAHPFPSLPLTLCPSADLYVRFTLQEAMKTTMELATLGVETRLLKEHDVSGGGGSGKDGGGAKAAAPGPTVGSSGPGSGSSGTAIDPETGESAHDHGMVLAAFDSMSTEER